MKKVKLKSGDYLWVNPEEHLGKQYDQHGYYEARETGTVKVLSRPGWVALDVGAHVGYYTMQLARWVKPGGEVISFEPDPKNFELLVKGLNENKIDNVTAVNMAASDTIGGGRLYQSKLNNGDHRIWDPGDNRPSVEIKVTTIDETMSRFGIEKVDFIKMDVQGVEPEALRGAEKTIAASPDILLLVEFWRWGLKDPEALLDQFESYGFKMGLTSGGGRIVPTTRKYLMDLPKRSSFRNVFLRRKQ